MIESLLIAMFTTFRLVQTTDGTTAEASPTFRVTFTKESAATEGYGGYPEGPLGVDRAFSVSYKDLVVDIQAVADV